MNSHCESGCEVDSAHFSIEGILNRVRERGQRITGGRRAILRVLFDADAPMSIADIQQACKNIVQPPPDYATVFRTIVLLEGMRVVCKVNMQKSCSYFELRDPKKHYDHLICSICGRVLVLDIPCPVREAEKLIHERYGFCKLSHSLEFFGVCPECAG